MKGLEVNEKNATKMEYSGKISRYNFYWNFSESIVIIEDENDSAIYFLNFKEIEIFIIRENSNFIRIEKNDFHLNIHFNNEEKPLKNELISNFKRLLLRKNSFNIE